MDKKEMKIAAEEFKRDRNLWTQARSDRLYYREQQLDNVADRQRVIIINLSAMAVAIAGIAIAIVSFKGGFLATLAIIVEIIASIIGIALSRAILEKDDRDIKTVLEDEQELLKKYQLAATENYNKAIDGNLTEDDVKKYFSKRKDANKLFKAHQKKDVVIDKTYTVLIVLFYLGILLLLVSTVF